MNMLREKETDLKFLGSGTISHLKLHIPSKIRKQFELDDGDMIMWFVDQYDRLFIKKANDAKKTPIIGY